MPLPILISVPHAGLLIPPEVADQFVLTPNEVAEDGDEGAAEIYAFEPDVTCFVATDIARAVIDLNRSEDDRRKDGVIKTHTCWDVPAYREFPSEGIVQTLLAQYYRPCHARLTRLAERSLRLAVDCHTMAAFGPPVGPDPGIERPSVCLSNADGTCPQSWIDALKIAFENEFGANVKVNEPFQGGTSRARMLGRCRGCSSSSRERRFWQPPRNVAGSCGPSAHGLRPCPELLSAVGHLVMHESHTAFELRVHGSGRGVMNAAVARQHPLELVIKESGHRACLFFPGVPAHISKCDERLTAGQPGEMVT